MIAALYVETNGVYFGLEDVDPWDEARDARKYAGPWPVVAHPPCARWSRLASIHQERWPIGADGGCFAAALLAVRTFGGVLEHPAESYAWDRFHLPAPARGGWSSTLDAPGCYATEIDQARYGHKARKRTWIYYVGPNPPALDWVESGGLYPLENMNSHNGEASRTPFAFRDTLLDMARSVNGAGTAAVGVSGLPPERAA
jgi:hypothetical protein